MVDGFVPATAANSGPLAMNYYSPPDPTKYLPVGTPADRYRALVQRVEDLRALLVPFDTRHQVSLDRLAVEARLKKLTGHRSVGGFELKDGDPQLVPVRKESEDLVAEQKRLTELDADRSKAAQSGGTLLSNVRAWVGDGRQGTVMESIKVPTPKLSKGETITAAIDRLRQQAKDLRTKLVEIERAPEPSAVARAKAREQLAALAARGTIDVCRLVGQAGGKIDFPETQLTLKVYNSEPAAVAIGQVPDVLSLLALLNGPALTAICDKAIAATSDDAHALTTEQRQKQTAQNMDALFAVELDQATLTFEAWRDGLPIEANPDIQPAAVLAVRNVVAPPVDTSTSPEHAYTVRR